MTIQIEKIDKQSNIAYIYIDRSINKKKDRNIWINKDIHIFIDMDELKNSQIHK